MYEHLMSNHLYVFGGPLIFVMSAFGSAVGRASLFGAILEQKENVNICGLFQ